MWSLPRLRALEQPARFRPQASLLPLALLWVLIHLWSGPRVLQAWCQGLAHQVAFFLPSSSHAKLKAHQHGSEVLADAALQQHSCIHQVGLVILT